MLLVNSIFYGFALAMGENYWFLCASPLLCPSYYLLAKQWFELVLMNLPCRLNLYSMTLSLWLDAIHQHYSNLLCHQRSSWKAWLIHKLLFANGLCTYVSVEFRTRENINIDLLVTWIMNRHCTNSGLANTIKNKCQYIFNDLVSLCE